MAILSFPSITPDTLEFGIKYNTQISTTSLTGAVTTIEIPGARWKGSMSFKDLTLEESADLKAFLLELRGMSGRFYFGDLSHTDPFDTITGEPIDIEGTSTPRLIDVTPSSGAFQKGDYVQISNDTSRELKLVVGVSGSSPQTLQIEPLVRRTDYKTEDLYYDNPTGVFMLDTDEQASWAIRRKALLSDINISFIEA